METINKGKAGQIGEIRTWAGKKYQKTAKGWRPVEGNANKAGAKEPEPKKEAPVKAGGSVTVKNWGGKKYVKTEKGWRPLTAKRAEEMGIKMDGKKTPGQAQKKELEKISGKALEQKQGSPQSSSQPTGFPSFDKVNFKFLEQGEFPFGVNEQKTFCFRNYDDGNFLKFETFSVELSKLDELFKKYSAGKGDSITIDGDSQKITVSIEDGGKKLHFKRWWMAGKYSGELQNDFELGIWRLNDAIKQAEKISKNAARFKSGAHFGKDFNIPNYRTIKFGNKAGCIVEGTGKFKGNTYEIHSYGSGEDETVRLDRNGGVGIFMTPYTFANLLNAYKNGDHETWHRTDDDVWNWGKFAKFSNDGETFTVEERRLDRYGIREDRTQKFPTSILERAIDFLNKKSK